MSEPNTCLCHTLGAANEVFNALHERLLRAARARGSKPDAFWVGYDDFNLLKFDAHNDSREAFDYLRGVSQRAEDFAKDLVNHPKTPKDELLHCEFAQRQVEYLNAVLEAKRAVAEARVAKRAELAQE